MLFFYHFGGRLKMESQLYKEWIGGIFDRAADSYGEGSNGYFAYFAEGLVNFADSLNPQSRILDVATGRGAIVKNIFKKIGHHAYVTGIDLSQNMITKTSAEFPVEEFPHLKLLCMDAEHLNFEDCTFDQVFCGFGLFFFPHVDQALKEFRRVLKPGGELFISTWRERDHCQKVLGEALEKMGIQGKAIFHNFEEKEFISQTLMNNGFDEIEITHDEYRQVYPSFEDWINSLWSHACRGKMEKLRPEQLSHLKNDLEEKLHTVINKEGLSEFLRAYYSRAKKSNPENR